MRHVLCAILFALTVALPQGCAKAPTTLSPVGVADWNTLQIGHDLDLVRDIVDAGTKTSPPVFTRELNVKTATWHKAAVTTLATRPQGWKITIQTGLDQLLASLTPAERDKLTPYALLIKTILASS